jgi:CheY-like chemotaxis protein
LTISKALLDLHGGTISVESEGKNQGTTFRVFLGFLPEPVTAPRGEVSNGVRTSKSLRLLLVDDHADTRGVLSRLLTKSGHDVVTADCAQKAVEFLESRQFDALISDIGLPVVNGYDLVRAAKRKQPLKAVALSGFGTDADIQRSLEAGFDYHVTKPIDFDGLRLLLQKIAT